MKKKVTVKSDYLDPRWQKKRLEVMEKAGFKCRCCGDTQDAATEHALSFICSDCLTIARNIQTDNYEMNR